MFKVWKILKRQKVIEIVQMQVGGRERPIIYIDVGIYYWQYKLDIQTYKYIRMVYIIQGFLAHFREICKHY